MRVGALQDCPEFLKQCAAPPPMAFSKSASSRMMLADLPPSSCVTRFTVGAARWATSMPARVEPVNEIMSRPGCEAMGAPTSSPSPLTRLNTPAGTPASCRTSAKISADVGVYSEGFMNHGAAGGQRRSHFAGDLVQRPIPGRDHAGHANGLAQEHRGAEPLLERIGLEHLKRGHQMAKPGARLGTLGERAAARPSRPIWRRRSPSSGPCRPR